MPPPKPADTARAYTVLTLRIDLEEVEPAVWRRLMVPGQITLGQLHRILQAAMGWSDLHLHAFEVGERSYGPDDPEDDPPDDQIDEDNVSVLEALDDGPVHEFLYEYDFGDGWSHRILVESRVTQDVAMEVALCLGGAQACPPDDVGGPDGYEAFLTAISDPGHEEHQDYLEWVGGNFDPAEFDLDDINLSLQAIR
jgi:hypothetical protein